MFAILQPFGLSLSKPSLRRLFEACQQAGGCPAALTVFLLRQKKVSKEKATSPSGAREGLGWEWGVETTVSSEPGTERDAGLTGFKLRCRNKPK
ncbi:MAG: hypothetical protein ACK4VX_03230, partial [Polaromonas sp.]